MKKIAGGDWSDETVATVEQAVKQFAEDFGYDLDEEGHPVEEGAEPERRAEAA
jgi:F-type H+/Na+-transporting ATPase subunit alpha